MCQNKLKPNHFITKRKDRDVICPYIYNTGIMPFVLNFGVNFRILFLTYIQFSTSCDEIFTFLNVFAFLHDYVKCILMKTLVNIISYIVTTSLKLIQTDN